MICCAVTFEVRRVVNMRGAPRALYSGIVSGACDAPARSGVSCHFTPSRHKMATASTTSRVMMLFDYCWFDTPQQEMNDVQCNSFTR